MSDEPSSDAAEPPGQAEGVCARCGRPDAARFGGEFICDACYTACGSCCAEWFQNENEAD
ncbi:MAG: hypothetical protein HS117_10995 [Verrucomicrobiaceae bacterium]|nr:hypothetical protein [Verrucomicrobiaceae bacterium]